MNKQNIKNFTLQDLAKAIAGLDEKPYRSKQIFFWLYRRGARSFDGMKNLPEQLVGKLKKHFYIGAFRLHKHFKSKDGTEKFLFELSDRNFIEAILICTQNRNTVCLSTQVGCKFRCPFCASGRMGFIRNLSTSEIIDQILFLRYDLAYKITNYVFMGMGEPLDNCDNILKAISIMNDAEGLGIGAQRITISTCGIIPGICKLKDSGLQVNLSVSLHAADNKLRNELVPANKQYPLEKLVEACKQYIKGAGRTITLEYVLIKNKNHSTEDAVRLAAIAKMLKAKVNLIACSFVPGISFTAPDEKETNAFMRSLIGRKINVTLRKSKGGDIHAACGQLAGK